MNFADEDFLKADHVAVKVENIEDYIQCVIGSDDSNERDIPTYLKAEAGTTSPEVYSAPLCWTIKDNVVCSQDKRNIIFSSQHSNDAETYPFQTEHYQRENVNGPFLASIQLPAEQKIESTEGIEKQVFTFNRNCSSLKNENQSDLCHKCDACGKTFKYLSKLSAHKKAHSSERPFSCSVCSKQFARKSDQGRHEWIHTKAHKYKLEENSSSTVKKINKQKKTCLQQYICNECGKPFSYHWSLTRHQKVHVKKKSKTEQQDSTVYKCTMCEMTFTRLSYLVEHIKIHTGYTLFICEECGKRFVSSSSLARHQKIHTNEHDKTISYSSGLLKKENPEEYCKLLSCKYERDLEDCSTSEPQKSLVPEKPCNDSNYNKNFDQKCFVKKHQKGQNACP